MDHVRKSKWLEMNPNNLLLKIQYIRNRKQIPLCKSCHKQVHAGKYHGIALKKIAYKEVFDSRIAAIESYIINKPQNSSLANTLQEKGWTPRAN